MKNFLSIVVLLLSTVTAQGQYGNNTYTVNITGGSSITLFYPSDYHASRISSEAGPFDGVNIMGTYYPDTDGVIRIELTKGYYEYITEKQGMNGSFTISRRNVYFDIFDLPPLHGIDTGKLLFQAYRCLSDKQTKKARQLFQTAADAGNVKAMFAYARMCYNGMGGRKNKNHAYHYIMEAQKHGDSMASYLLENFNDKRSWKWYL